MVKRSGNPSWGKVIAGMPLVNRYASLIHRTQKKCHFLWGPTSYALLEELDEGNKDLILRLASSNNPIITEIVIGVLCEFSYYSPQAAQHLLNDLVKVQPLEAVLAKGSVKERARIVIEVSQRTEHLPLLIDLATRGDQSTQLLATQTVYYLARDKPRIAIHVLNELISNFQTSLGLPRISVLRASLVLSILTLQEYRVENSDCQEWLVEMKQAWQKLLDEVPLFHFGILRRQLIRSLTKFSLGLANSLVFRSSYLRELADFFNASETIKKRYLLFVEYLNPHKRNLNNIYDDLIIATKENEIITSVVIGLILIVQGYSNFHETFEVARSLFYHALNQQSVGVYPNIILIAIGKLGVSSHYKDDEFYYSHQNMCRDYLMQTNGYFKSNLSQHWNSGLGEHVLMRKLRRNPEDEDLTLWFLQKAIREQDWILVKHILEVMVYAMGTAFSDIEGTLDLLAVVANTEHRHFQRSFVSLLSMLYRYYPALIDAFVDSCGLSEEMILEVKSKYTNRSVWEDFIQVNTISILSQAMHSPEFCRKILMLLREMPEYHNVAEFAEFTFESIIGLIYE